MKHTLFLLSALPLFLFAQNEKGVNPVQTQNSKPKTQNSVRAVVIGISDYQDAQIPDLRFAHRDAEAFANFLKSPAGGSLDGDHLQVLLNQNATAGRVAEALDALIEQAKEGDEVIIYFSGHGDVERKIISQPGFLLCWDAPSRVYMGGGTYSLAFLESVVTTLSVENKAKVVVVTDACHAGKLAGSQIGGAKLTAANLARQFSNEVKILSCQPGELSLEGEQWGGGRGIFSYHLVDGLFGLADRNADGQVTLGELDRYLEDKVTAEAAPQSQVPMLLGNKTERLATVNTAVLAALQKAKASGMPVFAATEGRGFEEEILAKADSSVRQQYLDFKKAVAEKRFFFPEDDCAEKFYIQLAENEALAPLRGMMKRNYAAALQDDAQQVMNSFLKIDMAEITRTRRKKIEKYSSYPALLDKAAQLLGAEHYFYSELMARKYIFEGFLKYLQSPKLNDRATGNEVLQFYREALRLQPDNPLTFHLIARVYINFMVDQDSAEAYVLKAVEHAPGWILPMGEFAFDLTDRFWKHEQAKSWLDRAYTMDPTSAYLMNQYGILNLQQGRFQEADSLLKKAIEYDSTNTWYIGNYARSCEMTGKYQESEQWYFKLIRLDSTNVSSYINLGNIYVKMGSYENAERWYRKSIEVDSFCSRCLSGLGMMYINTNRVAEGQRLLHKAVETDSTNIWAWNHIGNLCLEAKDYPAAIDAYRSVLRVDSTMKFATFAYSGTGSSLERTGRLDEATHAFRRAILLDSTNIWAMCGWARALLKKGALEAAAAQLGRAKSVQESDWVAYHFILLDAQSGRHTQALERLDAIVKKIGILDYAELQEEPLLEPLRELPEWKALMKKHFPDQAKD